MGTGHPQVLFRIVINFINMGQVLEDLDFCSKLVACLFQTETTGGKILSLPKFI